MEAFEKLGLSNEILKSIGELGFKNPTPIQEKTIPAIINSDKDLIALAQTGTGKTAGFGLPVIQQIETSNREVQSLILCPTRELCLQIARDLENYTKYKNNISIVAVYGGTNIQAQIKDLKKGAHIVVGTPGRTLDLISRKSLKINHIKWMILDEADEMLNMGFKDELDAILAVTPEDKQTLLFSATMPKEVRRIASNYMNNPDEITVGERNKGADTVTHLYYLVREADRYSALKRLADVNPNIYAIVFCRTRAETKEVADKLMGDGYNADALHGDLSQAQRDYVMQRFRVKNIQILVATDVAARGLDVNELTHVINYKLPDDPEIYVHRSGRTGRAGRSGVSVALLNGREKSKLKSIEKMMKKTFVHATIPSGREICEKQLFNLINQVCEVDINESEIDTFMPAITKKLKDLDRDELIKRFVSVQFNQFLDYYRDAKDLNYSLDENRKERDRGGKNKSDKETFTTISINLGKRQKVDPSYLIGVINELTGDSSINLGRIDINDNLTYVDVENGRVDDVLVAFQGLMFNDIELQVKSHGPSKGRGGNGGGGKHRNSGGRERRNGNSRNDGGRNNRGRNNRGKSTDGGGRRKRYKD
ncbi:MAG: DEAD/DEAH box helicase [Bacteroidales bacterium]